MVSITSHPPLSVFQFLYVILKTLHTQLSDVLLQAHLTYPTPKSTERNVIYLWLRTTQPPTPILLIWSHLQTEVSDV